MKILFFLLALVVHKSYEANILGLMNMASPSHSIWNNILLTELAEKGHNVTTIISDLPRNPKDMKENITYFVVEEVYKAIYEDMELTEIFEISPHTMVFEFCNYCAKGCNGTLRSKGFQKFMETYDRNFKFDLILYDYTCGPCLTALVEYFNFPPLVGVSAFPVPSFGNSFIGGHYHPSYISYHSATLSPANNFVDRMYNHLLYLLEAVVKKFSFYPRLNELVKAKYFSTNKKTVGELEKYTTISLVNSHPAITPAEPVPPNVIEIGGLQLIDPEPLPKDLDKFILSAKKGAVLFSLGTNIRPEDVSENHMNILLEAFKKFPDYNFLWKFDATRIKSQLPKNILIANFFPQRDILSHSNTKAFITHCGGLSTHESVWYGVPMIGFPFFVDQLTNARELVQKEIGVHIDFNSMTQQSFEKGLKEILENPKYMDNIKLMSKRFRDRPAKPLDTAIWWIEYILRNPNPSHLKPKTLEMNFFTANSLDFLLLVSTTIHVLLITTVLGLVWLLCCRRSKQRRPEKKLKKK